LVCILFDNKIYISNIGDSRAIMSINGGTKIKQLSVDHKPNNPKEFERAIKNGSQIYVDNDDPDRDISKLVFIKDKSEFEKYKNEGEEVIFREYPSDLAVMRTIGDVKVKNKDYGGKPGTIISTPEIFIYDISSTDDFIVMGCDGIFDDLSNQDVVDAAWYIYNNRSKAKNYDIHELSQEACDMIIKYGLEKETSDNLSCIIIGLEGLEKYLKNKVAKDKVSSSLNNFKKDFKRAQTLK
jgi:serine/threonine protein phosphatase PrpC